MIERLLEKINKIKNHLEDDPNTIVFGEIKVEDKSRLFDSTDPLKDYYELLNRYSYLSCGSILLLGYEDVDKFQYYLTEIPESKSNWMCIGKSHTYPIFINANDCTVSILKGEPWTNQDFRNYGHFNDFMNEYVIGGKYKELSGEDDWYNFLVNIGMV